MIGIDIVNIKKFKLKLEKRNFMGKIFTDNEIHYALDKDNSTQTFAGIFAAKEAIIKACGLNLAYILRKRIEIKHIKNIPYVKIDNKDLKIDLSISHEKDFAIAVCTFDSKLKDIEINKDVKKLLKRRKDDSHKGDFGKVAIIGGSKGMSGSVFLSSKAALRSGAGLSYIICPSSISNILQIKSTECIIEEVDCDKFYYNNDIGKKILSLIEKKDAIGIGPGMGKGKNIYKLLDLIIKNYDKNIVIDADGINALSNNLNIIKGNKNIIITPHEMEFSRISNIPLDYIRKNRIEVAYNFAKKNKITLVLKGKNTVVTNGNKIYVNNSGNSGMATAGSGDVLTGIILSNISIMDPFEASKLSVYMHGLAGDIYALENSEDSLIASDIVENLSKAYKIMRY